MSLKIALAGNPTCGKTTLFNALTGSAQYVGHPDMLPEEVHIGSEFKSEKFYRFCLKWVAPVFTFFILIGQLNTFFGLKLF